MTEKDLGKKDNSSGEKRATLSIKVGSSGFPNRAGGTSSGSRTIEVEIKKKRKSSNEGGSGVVVKKNMSVSEETSGKNSSRLTDLEFKARVRALQEAMKLPDEADNLDVEIPIESPDKLTEAVVDEQSSVNIGIVTESDSQQNIVGENIVSEQDQNSTLVNSNSKAKFQRAKRANVAPLNSSPVVFKSTEYAPKITKKESVACTTTSVPSNSSDNATFQQVVDGTHDQKNVGTKITKKKNSVDDDSNEAVKKGRVEAKKSPVRKVDYSKKLSRDVLSRVLDNGLEERTRSIAAFKRAKQKLKNSGNDSLKEIAKVVRVVDIPSFITVSELSNRMAVRTSDVIKYLMRMGTMATINQSIDADTAEVICTEFGHTPNRVSESDIEKEIDTGFIEDESDIVTRVPIVAVMGHVDHGKTTLLDTIRKSNVVQKESGGITQHVAAYQIRSKRAGKLITFIDTPGHAAFSKIRSRGATVTDIVVLVVAADDGVKEQTLEAISHAKSQNVPIIVAINKIDKPNINVDRVKTELLTHGVVLEQYGGDVLSCEVSALKGLNLEDLEDVILLQAEIMQLRANLKRNASGTVLESRVDKGRGIVASVIIQNGTLEQGDVFVAGSAFGKIRTIYNDRGERLKTAGPSDPIEIVGFDSSSEPGSLLSVVETEQTAREIAEYRTDAEKMVKSASLKKPVDIFSGRKGTKKELNLIIKADVFGSLEAICVTLLAITHEEVLVSIVDRSVGVITESDVDFAASTGAKVLGFGVGITSAAKELSHSSGVEVKYHNIIYKLIEDVKLMMSELLSPIIEEKYTGAAEVRKIFLISRLGTIAGCYVVDGVVKRNDSKIKVMRGGKVIFEGKMKSMKHEKEEIKEARKSYECGILADGFNDFQEGDIIESYEIILKKRVID